MNAAGNLRDERRSFGIDRLPERRIINTDRRWPSADRDLRLREVDLVGE
jgi:hypothetical protein